MYNQNQYPYPMFFNPQMFYMYPPPFYFDPQTYSMYLRECTGKRVRRGSPD